MKKAGKALKRILEIYGITQNRLAVAMGIGRSAVNNWVNEISDPPADTLLAIRSGLHKINSEAAEEFIKLYLSEDEF
jgi:transcriptional regulator with XRE-family HTH domain